jgi:hypothetical protein
MHQAAPLRAKPARFLVSGPSDLATPDKVRSYAARLPPLGADGKLFAAALFPVVATPDANLAEPDLEAQTYDDTAFNRRPSIPRLAARPA